MEVEAAVMVLETDGEEVVLDVGKSAVVVLSNNYI